jgi:surfactin synthase thioesterase subunit
MQTTTMTGHNRDKINLICFPYAGGSRYSYTSFETAGRGKVNIMPFELPGRGDRMEEPLLTDIHAMADDLFRQIRTSIMEPYMLYGHSLGAILAYLVTNKIAQHQLPLPRYVFVSGSEGPSIVRQKKLKLRSTLPPNEFIKELKSLGGVPEAVLQDESFLNFFEPVIRADVKAIESYQYQKNRPIKVPVCAFYGTEEDLLAEDVYAWQDESPFTIEVIPFPGDHFFIFKHNKEIIHIIEGMVSKMLIR